MLSWRRDIAFIEEEGETLEEGKKYKRYLLLSPLIWSFLLCFVLLFSTHVLFFLDCGETVPWAGLRMLEQCLDLLCFFFALIS